MNPPSPTSPVESRPASPGAGQLATNADVLVTGATGNVGGELVRLFGAAGLPVRAAVPEPEQARFGDGVEPVALDFRRPDTFAGALDGVRRVFLVRPPAIADVKRTLLPFLDAAERAGVEHVVFLSLQGAGRNPLVPHRTVEKRLEASGLAWTFLRPSFFMQNLSGTHRADLRDRSELFVPAGRGRTAFVDARDVALVAFLALTEPGHERRAYTLTGAEALTYADVAAVFTGVLGRPIRYADPSLVAFWRRMRAQGHPAAFVAVTSVLYTAGRFGLAGSVTDDLARLLGRPPRTLRTFAEDYRALWEPGTAAA